MKHREALKRRIAIAGVIVLFAVPGSQRVEAQRWGRPTAPRAGACFYRDANFQGDYFCSSAGQDISQVPDDMNDRISSIRTFGDTEVTIFQDSRFRGRSEQFGGNIRNLRNEGWNDRLSSIRLRSGFRGQRDRFQSRGNDSGGRGRFNADPDRIVRRAYQDLLDREPDAAGLRLYRSRIIDDDWTEDQVREALRRSPEYRERNTMTRAKAEEIVRRAYLSVLGREPDPGSQGYVNSVLREKWTEQDVARELRRSDEFRNRNR
jgi:hypothetical protein